MKLWKRNAVVAMIVLFVCVAVYLNWSYQKEEADVGKTLGQAALVSSRTDDPLLPMASPATAGEPEASAAPTTTTGYFASARLNRQQARDNALSILQETMSSESAEEAAKLDAGAAIETLATSTVSEAQIENLVVAKGYADCVAFMGENSISVVVSAAEDGLQTEDVAKIKDIVLSETDYTVDQIKIMEAT